MLRHLARGLVGSRVYSSAYDACIVRYAATVPAQGRAGSFSMMKLRPEVVKAINSMGITAPTEIQVKSKPNIWRAVLMLRQWSAIPNILQGRDTLIASETGSLTDDD